MFDKNKFAQILKQISETYDNQRDFSQKSGINRTYLSQYINMKIAKPPKPEILARLAEASKGIISYRELMSICGYIDLPYSAGFEFASDNDKLCIKKAIDYAILNNVPPDEIQNNSDIISILKGVHDMTLTVALDVTSKEVFKEKDILGRNITANNSTEDTSEIRAIARGVAKLNPEKKELFKNLLKQMSDETDEADEANKK